MDEEAGRPVIEKTPHSDKVGNMDYKGYQIVNDGTYGLKRIKMVGRGALPVVLRGRYTNQKAAEHAIDAYEATKAKGKRNAEGNVDSTD